MLQSKLRSLLFLFLYIITLIFFSIIPVYAQQYAENNTFRSANNPHYWKNKMPHAGYWQQDVHYKIDATVDEKYNLIIGSEKLTYWNNSPDTLKEVFFHLYQNAFQPESYYHNLHINNKTPVKFGPYEQNGLGTLVKTFSVNGDSAKIVINNTIMRVFLPQPLLPGAKAEFDITFNTYFDVGSIRRRMKIFGHDGVKHFDGVHWYPRISVYDRKFGWTTDQHLGREFYGDYGSFDVSLTLPSHYILDATGVLQNQEEVLPKELRAKLDIKNFKDKKLGEKPSEIVPNDGKTKTWRFYAENVHDFSWTADPTYRIGEVEWNGIKCVALAQEQNASRWQSCAPYLAKIIETFSKDFGMYAWPKIIVADARDGMEYPMLTLCGGLEPDYHFVIAHEVGHQWFYGMLGNNETYRAFLDEGFTQFLTIWGLEATDGKFGHATPSSNKYIRRHYKKQPIRETSLFQRYLSQAVQEDKTTLNTHSDDFGGALRHGGGYSMVYHKSGTMLYNLQYVLGDSLFLAAMKNYVAQWKFCHPYPEDFRNSIIHFTKTDLNWFFDQWLETSKTIDYKVKNVKKADSAGKYTITFLRKGEMQMPLDFTAINTSGEKFNFYVPNNYFIKNTNATVLPMWHGWGKLHPDHKTEIQINGKLKDIIIDTTHRLADINLLNNSKKFPLKTQFDWQVASPTARKNYELFWRPELWYNSIDGIKAGIHLNGDYFNLKHGIEFTGWYNTTLLKDESAIRENAKREIFNFNFSYKNPLFSPDHKLSWFTNARILDGLYLSKLGIGKSLSDKTNASLFFKTMWRPEIQHLDYLLYPGEWNADKWNNTINANLTHSYNQPKSNGYVNLDMRSSTFGSDYSYSTFNTELLHKIYLKKFVLKNRLFGSISTGSEIAPESKLFLAQSNPEEMMENKFVRSRAFVPLEWLGYGKNPNHFHHGGGLNLRGYSGYLTPQNVDTGQVYTYSGTTGAAINLELEFDKLVNFKPKFLSKYFSLNTYLFFDGGLINYNNISEKLKFADFRMDAGLGTALTIKSWGALQKVKPLTIRFDMPFYVSHVPFTEKENVQFRWILGVGRAF